MTRVLHVTHTLDPASGGVAAVCARLAREQLHAGTDARVLARHAPPAGALPALPPESLHDAVRGCDLVHLHGVWDWVLFRAARAARRAGRPYVVSPHGMLDPWSLRQKWWKKRLALALGFRHMLDSAATLHALNDDEAELMRPLGLHCPVSVVPNGVSLEEIDAPHGPDEFRHSVPGLGAGPYVLFLGRLHHKKGLDTLADAFRRVAERRPDAALVVAGPDEGARDGFLDAVTRAGLAGRVHLTGPLFGRAKWAALAGAACFCLLSRQEGFSVAVLEALASRTPVVISHACHFAQVEAVGAGHVVSSDNGVEAGEAILRILIDRGTKLRMGNAGRSLVEENFTWPKIVEQMAAVYRRAVGSP